MNYKFSVDWYCGTGDQNFIYIFEKYGIPTNIIEIGCYEGWTTFRLSDNLTPMNHQLKIYAIDPHDYTNDLNETIKSAKENFHYNLQTHQYKNVTHINKYSKDALIELIDEGVQAEFIYIDGDHRAHSVLEDLVLSWQLLKVGGVILCDDSIDWKFKDGNGTESAQMSPRMAIEMFIQCNWHRLNILRLPNYSQTAFMKVAE